MEKSYNIYAWIGNGFECPEYKYTDLFDSYDDAEQCAYEEARESYESESGIHGIPSYQDIVEQYCEEEDLEEEELTKYDYQNIDEMYNEAREDWLCYKVVLTEEDNIDKEDLILNYVVEDGSPDEAPSSGD